MKEKKKSKEKEKEQAQELMKGEKKVRKRKRNKNCRALQRSDVTLNPRLLEQLAELVQRLAHSDLLQLVDRSVGRLAGVDDLPQPVPDHLAP